MPTTARKLDDRESEGLGDFVTGTETLILSPRAWEAFVEEWNNPSEPTPEALEAVRLYRSLCLSDAG